MVNTYVFERLDYRFIYIHIVSFRKIAPALKFILALPFRMNFIPTSGRGLALPFRMNFIPTSGRGLAHLVQFYFC
jgi:hypothetical protein